MRGLTAYRPVLQLLTRQFAFSIPPGWGTAWEGQRMDEARARDVVFRGVLAQIRNGHDADFCRRNIVKPARKLLRPPENVAHVSPEMERARALAARSLDRL